MTVAFDEEAVLSREELDALLEEIPRAGSEGTAPSGGVRARASNIELERANEAFAVAYGQLLSNRHERVLSLSLLGQREVEMTELAELMLPTDLVVEFRVEPKSMAGFILLSRPLFFQLLSMNFGAGPTMKPIRPPTREYSRIERRFYERAARELLAEMAKAWNQLEEVSVDWVRLAGRSAVMECESATAILATYDVRGFGEACRIRVAIPASCFVEEEGSAGRARNVLGTGPEVSLMDVPIQIRAQVGTARLSLRDVGRLQPGQTIDLETPSDGSLTLQIGGRDKFKAIPGTRGPRRAVQLSARIGEAE